MKERVERFVILPFSSRCSSQSSVDVASTHQHIKPNPPIKKRKEGSVKKEDGGISTREEEEEETKVKPPQGVSDSPKLSGSNTDNNNNNNNNNNNISDGIFRFIRSFKSFSHSFFFIRDGDETEEEMEIGFPTDVKHLTHIGIDGTMTSFDAVSTPSSFPFGGFSLAAA